MQAAHAVGSSFETVGSSLGAVGNTFNNMLSRQVGRSTQQTKILSKFISSRLQGCST